MIKLTPKGKMPDNTTETQMKLAVTKLLVLQGEAKQQVGRRMLEACREEHRD